MLDQASASLAKAVELQPDKKLYRNNLATVKVEQGQIDEAYTQLAAVHPVGAAHYNLGFLLVQKGNQQAAAAQFQQAMMADPSLTDAQKWLAKLGATPEAQLASSRRTPPPTTQMIQTQTMPTQQMAPRTETRLAEAPLPATKPDYLQPQGSSNFQVRYPQPSGESRSADDGAVPPTPDRFNTTKPAEPSGDALRMLPPVNSAYFAPSRY
jgi:tetratricopeptide (TPR) repeat protein